MYAGSIKCQVCKIGFLLPFLGDLRHFWVKVDKLYPFWEKIEILALKMLFVVKWGCRSMAFEGVCENPVGYFGFTWVFWV